ARGGTTDPVTRHRTPGVDECWRDVDVIAKARGGKSGGSPIAEHDPVGEYVTDDSRGEVYATLEAAALDLQSALGALANARARLLGRIRTERRRVEMRQSQSWDHDTANAVADDYDARKRRGQKHARS